MVQSNVESEGDGDAAIGLALLSMAAGAKIFRPVRSQQEFDTNELAQQVKTGFKRRNKEIVQEVFARLSSKQSSSETSSYLPKSQLLPLFRELGVNISAREAEELFDEFDTGNSQGLDLQELLLLLQKPSRLHEWAMSLPLHQLLADAIPRKPGIDPLRVVSKLTAEERSAVCDMVRMGLERMLEESSELLCKAFLKSDQRSKESFVDSSKFNLQSFSCGSIDDFHNGVEARIGEFVCLSTSSKIAGM
jgi:hypothetical protein